MPFYCPMDLQVLYTEKASKTTPSLFTQRDIGNRQILVREKEKLLDC